MLSHSAKGLCILFVVLLAPVTHASDFGRPASPAEVKLWDIDVRPDGAGLPRGRGTVPQGKQLYTSNCEACHGASGEGGIKDRLVGGQGSLVTNKPIKTIGSYWPYATTLFDYIRRAMPYTAPGTLSNDNVYALVAYLLNLNGIVPANATLDQNSLPKVTMPNRDGFVPDSVFQLD